MSARKGNGTSDFLFFLSYAVSPSGVHPREGQLLLRGQSRQQSAVVAELLVDYCLFFSELQPQTSMDLLFLKDWILYMSFSHLFSLLTWSLIAKADLELLIFLPPPSKCWVYRCSSTCMDIFILTKKSEAKRS